MNIYQIRKEAGRNEMFTGKYLTAPTETTCPALFHFPLHRKQDGTASSADEVKVLLTTRDVGVVKKPRVALGFAVVATEGPAARVERFHV